MGKSSSEIQNDIERRRNAIEARISRLDRRVRDDLDTTKDRIADRVSGTKESISSAAETVGSKLSTSAGADTAIAEHPGGLVAGAMAGGAVVGWVTGGSDNDHHDRRGHPSKSSEQDTDDGRGLMSGLIVGLIGSARGYAMGQAGDVVQTVVDGIKNGTKDHDDGKASRVYAGERHLPPAEDEEHPSYGRASAELQAELVETPSALQRGGRA